MRSKIIAIGLVVGTLVSASAFADEGAASPHGAVGHCDGKGKDKTS